MYRVWGFVDYCPDKQVFFDKILNIVEKVYSSFSYLKIYTPAVEKNSVLTSKWWDEVLGQIFWLYWLKQGCNDLKKYSLRFDLTIPFARYVLDWKDKIQFPFKRYQIQPVWRWERSQKWRYKEFIITK